MSREALIIRIVSWGILYHSHFREPNPKTLNPNLKRGYDA